MNIKNDFPIFKHNPWLVFLDNGASTQKPQSVIDAVSAFVSNDYANIHRGLYSLSEKSEEIYHKSKEVLGELLHCKASELFYTYNSTYGINIVAQSLVNSSVLTAGDVVLLGIWEHHSDIVPRQVLSKKYGFDIRFINIDDEYEIDRHDFATKYDEHVKVVAVSHASNVTGKIYDVKKIHQKLRDDTFFLIDGSQSVPHMSVDLQDIWCDAFVFTGHKMMAYTGVWVVYMKKDWIKTLEPMIVWGWTVKDVTQDAYILASSVQKFEAGTPNIIWAVSMLKACEYIISIWWFEAVWKHEQELTKYALKQFEKLADKVTVIGPKSAETRLGVFSFIIPEMTNFNVIGEQFAKHNICIRCGGHCAYPLHKRVGAFGTCRMSLYVYNTKEDIDAFFDLLKTLI